MKKYLVLGILFLLPITVYIFFASGVNNFAKLPILTHSISNLNQFKDLNGNTVLLDDKITVLGFFGNEVASKHANAFNLTHKIYKKNHGFSDFQFVFLMEDGTQDEIVKLKQTLDDITDTAKWKFVFGTSEAIQEVFNSLQSDIALETDFSTPFVFIIDKDRNLRGRDDDEDVGLLYGFDARDVAEINNKMSDDIKVILAEYRLELKKYKADREI
ncbi:hypothetical protein ATE92_1417 [Ulvibacter sp. MAR_2010_11]|uniref:hypothetical protein n=1 Tax=Ulvibacter sp. MAR_2010_11 TaxID=1250229 RepID=UPI000C2BFDA9|nr:hypothetical protein [Ulvibacter sp. MAR_2010_11]PKA83267.1 hypothetical protein ATE92_1417 [Ulvibacter sp. MAR_2010_11]